MPVFGLEYIYGCTVKCISLNPYDITPILERLTGLEKRAFDLIFSPEHPPKTVVDGKLSTIPIKELKTQSA